MRRTQSNKVTKKCLICGDTFHFPDKAGYIPETCNKFKCVFTFNHDKALQRQARMRNDDNGN